MASLKILFMVLLFLVPGGSLILLAMALAKALRPRRLSRVATVMERQLSPGHA